MRRIVEIVLLVLLISAPLVGQEDYVPTIEFIERDNEWWVLRGGETVKLHGAGVSTQQPHLLDYLASKGGTVTRTWGTNNIGGYLDRAHKAGVGVIVGFWMGHERHGFDYAATKEVTEQLERAKKEIRMYRDHPGVLMWAIGNEAESGAKDPDLVYRALSDLVAVAKEEGRGRPVITVVGEITREKIEKLNQIVPWLDGIGINSYGGIKTLGRRVTDFGWKKPFLVTEYGPRGAWDANTTSWKAPLEPTSSQKAAQYGSAFDAIARHPQCIGTLAFIWGWKQESTPTWYGMFLEDGSRLGAVDALQERWTGKAPRRRAPVIKSLVWPGDPAKVKLGAAISVAAEIVSTQSEQLAYEWTVIRESAFRKDVDELPVLEVTNQGETVSFTAPKEAGAYRLSVVIKSRRRSAATANVAFRVIDERRGKKED